MNHNLAERLLGLIRNERDAEFHHCNTRVDHALTRALGGDLAGARRAMESAARELYAAQRATTDALLRKEQGS